jgi:hypothetical protein
MLKTGDTFESQGKTWRFVGLDTPRLGQWYLSKFAGVSSLVLENVTADFQRTYCPIVEPVVPEWITPTDEHALKRPECEVRDYDCDKWLKGRTLICVRPGEYPFKFVTDADSMAVCSWKQCRIRNPELNRE